MSSFSFPSALEMTDALACQIAKDCGFISCKKTVQECGLAIFVLAMLALFQRMCVRDLQKAGSRMRVRQLDINQIIAFLAREGLLLSNGGTHELRKAPEPAQIAKWLTDDYFAPFCSKVSEWAKELLRQTEKPLPSIGVMWGRSEARKSPEDMPEFLTSFHIARILRIWGRHQEAYRLVADHVKVRKFVSSMYDCFACEELAEQDTWGVYYRALGHQFELSGEQPIELQKSAWTSNVIARSLVSLDEPAYTPTEAILEEDAALPKTHLFLTAVIFHSLQTGNWEPIRRIANMEKYYLPAVELAQKLCRWTEKQNWGALRGLQKLVAENAELSVSLAPFGALACTINKTSVASLLECTKYKMQKCGKAMYSFVEGLNFLQKGVRYPVDQEVIKKSPIGQFVVLLTALRYADAVELSSLDIAGAVAACLVLHRRKLTLYSWYMAGILLSMGEIAEESRTKLREIVASRSDLPPIPGVRVFTTQADHCLDKFLELAKELVQAHHREGKQRSGQLEWEFVLDSSGMVMAVEPIFRSLRKNGTLSAGCRVSLSDLKSGKYNDSLTAQDNAMIASIGYEASRRGGTYYLPRSSYRLLCDHPHVRVAWKCQKYQDISLSLRRPRLNVREQGDTYAISLPDEPCSLAVLSHLGGDHFALSEPSEAAAKIRQLIKHIGRNGEVILPAKGKKAVAEALANMSDQFQLTGDLGITDATMKELKSASRLVAQLRGSNGVFMGLLGIEPFAGAALLTPGQGGTAVVMKRGEEKVLVQRDLSQESALLRALLEACPTLSMQMGDATDWRVDSPMMALDILGELQDYGCDKLEMRWPEGESLSLSSISSSAAFRLQVGKSSTHWLQVGGDVRVDENRVLRFTELLERVRERQGRYVRLDEGHFLRLTRSITRQLETLSNLLPPADKNGRVRKELELSPAAVALLACSQEPGTLPPLLEEPVRLERERFLAHRSSKLPSALRAELRDYQLTGYRWLMQRISAGVGACLADDMGLGKTLQVLTVLLAKANEGPSLVLAPASVCANWVREAARFTPTLKMHRLSTNGREELLETLSPRDVLVCSYGLLVSESDALSRIDWNVVVLDEAQSIKNSQSRRAEQTRRLRARYRIAATGTPLENNLMELWSLMEFLNPGFLGAPNSFLSRFKDAPARLRQLIAPFVLRRLKGDVLDELPEKNELVIPVELSEPERALYETLRRRALQEVNADSRRFQVLAHLTRLRRLCCHPQLGEPNCGLQSSAKLETLRELAAELKSGRHRALIFSQFTDVLAHVRTLCEDEQFSYLYLDGSTPVAARAELVDAFQQGDTDFFLISLKAGGVGLNLTAADYVILLDPWWNPATEEQAADRAHRIGQDKNVTVCRLVCTDTIEQSVLELHARKRDLVNAVLSDSGATAASLSVAELLQLLQ